jgi:prophage DNA circulation protein
MTWRDDLRRVQFRDGRILIGASFRGVPFFVESAERSGGRRTVVHEFPLRDDPSIDDMGRRARTFQVEGYVLGDSYITQRNALLSALEDTAGPGELVHPYYGSVRAVCSSLATRESIEEGGLARFSLEFTEAPAIPLVPIEAPDLDAAVDVAATAAQAAIEAELVEDFDTTGQPIYAITSLAADLAGVAAGLDEALAPIAATTQELARLDVDIQSLVSDATTIVRDPAETMAAMLGVLGNLEDTIAESPRRFVQALLDAYDTDAPDLVAGDSDTRALERDNQSALSAALRRLLVIEAARALVSVSHETLEDAIADRTAVADRLEEQATTAGDTSYPALVELRAAVLRAVPGDAVLARQVTHEQRTSTPSLLLSYRLYGTVELEADIIARNAVQHPGFLSGSLLVLTDV